MITIYNEMKQAGLSKTDMVIEMACAIMVFTVPLLFLFIDQ
jgi:hypothetical protein